MKKTFPLLLLCLLTGLTFGQGKILRGFVYEKDGGAPIPYANIIIEEDRLGATTDFNGYFQISDVPIGLKEITVSYLGYEINQVEARIFG